MGRFCGRRSRCAKERGAATLAPSKRGWRMRAATSTRCVCVCAIWCFFVADDEWSAFGFRRLSCPLQAIELLVDRMANEEASSAAASGSCALEDATVNDEARTTGHNAETGGSEERASHSAVTWEACQPAGYEASSATNGRTGAEGGSGGGPAHESTSTSAITDGSALANGSPAAARTAVAGGNHSRREAEPPTTKIVKSKVGRNRPCPCGSGRRYKSCCLAVAAALERRKRAAIDAASEAGVDFEKMRMLYI